MTKKHQMGQDGKGVAGKKVDKDRTGAHETDMKEHGQPFGKKQKNTGGQWEKMGGGHSDAHVSEGMSPEEIAGTLTDEGVTVQQVFNEYAEGVNYVSLREFNEIGRAYGCQCHDEQQLLRLMESNSSFMFIEGEDSQGRYWVPQPIGENIANFGGKQGKPFGKPESEQGDSKKQRKQKSGKPSFGGDPKSGHDSQESGSESTGKPWEEGARARGRHLSEGDDGKKACRHEDTVVRGDKRLCAWCGKDVTGKWQAESVDAGVTHLSDDLAEDLGAIVEQVTGRPQGRKLKNGKRLPINEANVTGRGAISEDMRGYQEYPPEEMEERFRDPRHDTATDPGLSDFPMFGQDLDDEMGMADDPMGGDFSDDMGDDAMGGSPMRDHDHLHGSEGTHDEYGGGETCPECPGSVAMDELGCPECGYDPNEVAQGTFSDPGDMAEFGDEMNVGGGPMYDGEEFDDFDDFEGAESGGPMRGKFESRSPGRRPLSEDGHKMGRPKGTSIAGKLGGKKGGGLPEEDTDTHEMGKEWPRKQKNTGSAQEEFGDSKHTEACDGIQTHHSDISLGGKQKNTGAQWEEMEGGGHGGKMTGGAKKMYEAVSALGRHVRRTLTEYARSSRLASADGRYSMRFVVSAGEHVKPKMHNNLTEALADAEELIQVFGPEAVSFEAQFCGGDGSAVMKRLVPMIGVPRRGPVVQEGAGGGRLLFRFPEIAKEFAQAVVSEGKACRATAHNWGAAVRARVTIGDANRMFRVMAESARRM